jgi:hypothetical protein
MATREAIVAAIEQGIARVEATFGGLTAEQLQTQVHPGEHGWTAGDNLAHLAGRAQVHEAIFSMAAGNSPFGGGFDVNAWNQAKVEERAGKSRDELLDEFRAVHEALLTNVQTLPDEQLAQAIQSPRGATTLGDMLRMSGGGHSVNHTIEIEQALGLAAPAS